MSVRNITSNHDDWEWSPVAKIKRETAEYYACLFRRFYPDAAEKANGRIERAVVIASTAGACRPGHSPGVYDVKSESSPKRSYEVDVNARTCTCPDKHPGVICKHRLAIGLHLFGPKWALLWQQIHIKLHEWEKP